MEVSEQKMFETLKKLSDNSILVNQELYDALKGRFQDSDVKDVRVVNDEEIRFLQNCGISYGQMNIGDLKRTIINNCNEKKIWVDRVKEVSTLVDVHELIAKLPEFIDIFKQIMGDYHFDTLINVLNKAFTLKIELQNGTNSDWDIFAFRRGENNQYQIAIFRIEALRINNQWDLYFFKWGTNAVKIDFLGYHLRRVNIEEEDIS